MLKRTILAVAALGLAAACGSSSNTSSTSTGTTTASGTTTGTTGVTVTAQNFAFSPATMTISAGQTVTWKNADSIDHTVTSGANGQPDGKFDQLLHPGDTFQFTFSQAGTYPYYCRFHVSMGMSGTVSVSGGSTTSTSTGTTGTTSSSTTTSGTSTSTTGTSSTSATTGRY